MSFEAMAWAVKKPLPAAKKCLLLIIANNANADGWFFHSYKNLAEDAGLSRRSTITYMKEFQDAGLISKEVRQRGNGSFTTNEWRLSIENSAANPGKNYGNSSGEPPAPPRELPVLPSESPALGSESPAPNGGESPALPSESVAPPGESPALHGGERVAPSGESVALPSEPAALGGESPAPPNPTCSESPAPLKTFKQSLNQSLKPVIKKHNADVGDWHPSDEVIETLKHFHQVPEAYIDEQLIEFKIYWKDSGDKKTSWNSAFLQRVIYQWKRYGQQWMADPLNRELAAIL